MRIRTLGLISVAALGISAPASAGEFIGTAELGAGWSFVDSEGAAASEIDDDSFGLFEGVARGNFALTDALSVQLDMGGLYTFTDDDGGNDTLQSSLNGALHVNWRNEAAAVGLLSQVGTSDGGATKDAVFYNFGAEALYNWTDFTFIGQGGFFWADDDGNNNVMTDAWWGRAVARWYATPHMRVQLDGAFSEGEPDSPSPSTTLDVFAWGARIDQDFYGPFGMFVSYDGNRVEENQGSADHIVDHTVLVGFNLRFGADSIEAADRKGPSFDTPDIGRWTGWTMTVVD